MRLTKIFRPSIMLALVVAVFALAACGEEAETLVPTATVEVVVPTVTIVTTATQPSPEITIAPRQLNVELQGDGPDVLGPFTLGTGVMIAFIRHDGEGPFSMTFLGGENGPAKSVNASPGPYGGERVHSVYEGNGGGLVPGEYTVEIEGAGPWRLRLFQEIATRGQSPEITLAGNGDGGGSWLRLDDGEYTMTTSHSGATEIIVELFDSSGLQPYRIVQATGDYEGEDRFTVGGGVPGENPQAGFYAMGVTSKGDWQVTITDNNAP